jgi:hypothetical protein
MSTTLKQRLEAALGQPIVTSHECPPIPVRSCDWCAYPEGEEEEGRYGYGATEKRALIDLAHELIMRERIPEDFLDDVLEVIA